MKTLEQKIAKAGMEWVKTHSDILYKQMDQNFAMRDEFATENTYKFSNLLISLATGIIGGTSFLISNIENLNSFSKILSLSLALPIISIIIELKYRNKVIDINREACDRRGQFIQKIMKEDAIRIFSNKPKTFKELEDQVSEINKIAEEGFENISKYIKKEEPATIKLRSWSINLLIISLISIILIVLSESKSIEFISDLTCEFFKFFKK